jgi:hypothetical protein
MLRLRKFFTALVAFCLLSSPVIGAPAAILGTLVYADGARVGTTTASVGSTVFGGDHLSTDAAGSVQVRTAAARFLLKPLSNAILLQDPGIPAAILTHGSGVFSTANANAFALHALDAVIKANSNQPTVGQVTILGSNELLVQSVRGQLACDVNGDTRVIDEGESYRVVLDGGNAAAPDQGPSGSGTGRPPRRAGRNVAVYYIAAGVAVLTIFALHEALESPDRP